MMMIFAMDIVVGQIVQCSKTLKWYWKIVLTITVTWNGFKNIKVWRRKDDNTKSCSKNRRVQER